MDSGCQDQNLNEYVTSDRNVLKREDKWRKFCGMIGFCNLYEVRFLGCSRQGCFAT